MSDGYQIVSLDEVESARILGFRAAGVDSCKAGTGDPLISPDGEASDNEELYVVVRGRARFTVDDEEADAPAGALVFVPPGAFRSAVAAEGGTIVLAVKGSIA